MKILVLCYEYPPLGGGGGRVAQSIAEQMAARGHEVRVQTAALGWKAVRERCRAGAAPAGAGLDSTVASRAPALQDGGGVWTTRETIGGVEVFRTASGRRVPDTCTVPEMGLYCATSFLPTLRHIREWKSDVIHAHFAVPTGALAWAVHRLTGVPYVLTAHLGDVPGGVPEQTDRMFRAIGPFARMIWRDAAAATAVSSFVQELAERAYARPVARILNGIEMSDAAPPRAEIGRPPHLIFLGRFNAQKQPQFLVDLLSLVRELPWRLTMIGDGPLRPAVEERIAILKLGDRITLTGWQTSAEVHRHLADADILCMPSQSEGMPVAAVEALKHGLAILASDIPGVRDVVADGVNGFTAPVADLASFEHKLRWLLERPETLLAMKHASWEKAHTFDLARIASEYEQVLHAAAGRAT